MAAESSEYLAPPENPEVTESAGGRPLAASPDIDRCLEELSRLAQSELAPSDFYDAFLEQAADVLSAAGGVVWQLESGRPPQLVSRMDDANVFVSRWEARVPNDLAELQVGAFVLPPRAREGPGRPFGNPYSWPLAIATVPADPRSLVAIELALDRHLPQDMHEGIARLLTVFSEIAGDFHRRRELAELRDRDASFRQFSALSESLHAQLDPVMTAYVTANDGRAWIGCDRLSVLRAHRGRATALAVSGVESIDRRSRQIGALERLAAAVVVTGESLEWQEERELSLPPEFDDKLHAYLDCGHARRLVAIPLRRAAADPEAVVSCGVLVAESFAADRSLEALAHRSREVSLIAGSALGNALTHHALPLVPVQHRLVRLSAALARRPVAVVSGIGVLAAALALLLWLPVELTVHVEGTLQPRLRRHLFAPSDGVVATALAEHGQRVEKGDVLLRIRNPQLDLDQSRLSGELQTARARLDAARSARSGRDHDKTPSDQERLASEQEQLELQIVGLESQLEILGRWRRELDVVSPLTGVVLTWRAQQFLDDRPVRQGQVLLTVADPSGPWELELRVPDSQAGHVLDGQRGKRQPLLVTYLIASDPAVTHRGHLERMALATDTASGKAEAEAIVALDGPLPPDARAGTHVVARVACGKRSLGYVCLRDAIDLVRRSLLF